MAYKFLVMTPLELQHARYEVEKERERVKMRGRKIRLVCHQQQSEQRLTASYLVGLIPDANRVDLDHFRLQQPSELR